MVALTSDALGVIQVASVTEVGLTLVDLVDCRGDFLRKVFRGASGMEQSLRELVTRRILRLTPPEALALVQIRLGWQHGSSRLSSRLTC